jgi:hypothetical protein
MKLQLMSEEEEISGFERIGDLRVDLQCVSVRG